MIYIQKRRTPRNIKEKAEQIKRDKTVKPHFIPDDFCKLFQSKSPVIKCGNDNDSKLFQS